MREPGAPILGVGGFQALWFECAMPNTGSQAKLFVLV